VSHMHQELFGNWSYPTMIRFGAGRMRELPDVCRETSITKPLLVTDPNLAKLPMVRDAVDLLKSAGIEYEIFYDIKTDPTGKNISDGVQVYREGGHDGVIALGGGSALDAGKAVAFMTGQNLPIWEFEDVGENWRKADPTGIAPVIALPTTSGTGSEVGRAAIILDTEKRAKRIIFHPKMLPCVVIADPLLTIGLPPHLTAATGMDALSHNLEAFCASPYHPMAEGIALEAMGLIKEWLPTAYRRGGDVTARSHMMAAASMGATAFQRGLGAMHALAHPLGAVFGLHHGLLNAVLMPYVLKANRKAIETRMTRLSRFLDLPNPSFESVLEWVLRLRAEVGIPNDLSQLGVDERRSEEIGRMAVDDPSSGTNPLHFDADDYSEILRRAIGGEI